MTLLLCPHCGTCDTPLLSPGTSSRVARATCAHCGAFLRWLPRGLVRVPSAGKDEAPMVCVNRCILVGTISPYGVERRTALSGTACAAFVLVLHEVSQDGKTYSTRLPCEVWGKKATAASELAPGTLVLFEGKLVRRKQGEQWEMVVAGWDVTPLAQSVGALTGSPA
jgi:hypothetical protein